MQHPASPFRPVPWIYRALAVPLIACLLLIGLAGLILPVIPGIVFLFLAAWLLTRVSRRAQIMAHGNPWFRRQMGHLRIAGALSVGDRAKLCLLLMARGAVDGMKALVGRLPGSRGR